MTDAVHPPEASPTYSEPTSLADAIRELAPPVLVALDVDGVLAPIVDHADDARLLDGVLPVLASLADSPRYVVAAVSGRTLADLRRFGFPTRMHLVGSHGGETSDAGSVVLDAAERERLGRLTALADDAAHAAGTGAWVEHKPAGVVLHVRQADSARGAAALEQLRRDADAVDGAHVKPGSAVLELLARPADKGRAVEELRETCRPGATVFVGDDVTDEDAFEVLSADDLGIKVGPMPTRAARRLADPPAVLAWLQALTDIG